MNDPKYNVSTTAKFIVQLGLLLMGEYPIKTARAGDLLFDGYDDPLLDVANSDLLKWVAKIFNHGNSILPFDIPPFKKMGYFVNVRVSTTIGLTSLNILICSTITAPMKITGLIREKMMPIISGKFTNGPI